MTVCAIAAGAISGLGVGREAFRPGPVGEGPRVAIRRDEALEAAGLARPFASRAPSVAAIPGTHDRATDLLHAAFSEALAGLDVTRAGWRSERVGVALGTSSGGMLTAERFFAARATGTATRDLTRGATYFAPADDVLEAHGLCGTGPRTLVLAACAASTIAIGLALRWLDRGACDLVLAGGFDGVSTFVASGFEVLRATTATEPRPFRLGRDGMSLGEGAAIVALVREDDTRGAPVLARIAGFGSSNDATHITAPDRTGAGLARAASAAIRDAGIDASQVDLVSAHGTATPFNDAMEARAIATALGASASPIVHAFKAQIGHTLGAAGVLEALAAADCLAASVAPATAGVSTAPLDPDAPVRLLERAEPSTLRAALKLSAAFGGSDAALVLTPPGSTSVAPRRARARTVHLAAWAHVVAADLVAVAEITGIARDRLARIDPLGRLGVAAVAELARELGKDTLLGAGIVAGQALATIDTNDGFAARLRARGPTLVEPRVFPATSPNAIVGECAIAFKLTGPGFAVGAGLDAGMEALAVGAELVAGGDADRIIVLAADDAGPAARDLVQRTDADRELARGAVAALIVADGPGETVDLDRYPSHERGPIGHLSLLRWLGGRGPHRPSNARQYG